jgi:pyrroline-5-carboxylate reductase
MNKNKVYRHGFIGCGKMAQILLGSLLHNRRVKPADVLVSRRSVAELKKIRGRFKVSTTEKNFQVAQGSRILWLGIKPFQAQMVLKEIAAVLRPGAIVISMMAGISTAMIRKHLGAGIPILRIMPNTPALLGCGVTGAFFAQGFPRQTQKKIIRLLQDLGEVLVLKNERPFDALTGVSGSGPAFVYTVAQGLIAGGRKEGLKAHQAKALAVETLLGAAAMLKITEQAPAELIAQVASKGGTTEAGLRVLKKYRVEEGMKGAVRAAAGRSREISRGLK